ncbi:MAG: epimerase, partial [Blastocatellia bacterium]
PGETFLAEVCVQWETESRRAEDLGVRTVLLRNGIVLSKDGGALATMLLPFKLGLGGVIGSGRQWMSWISL